MKPDHRSILSGIMILEEEAQTLIALWLLTMLY